jgi:hypothetical protein
MRIKKHDLPKKELLVVQCTGLLCEEALSEQSTQQATGYSMDK